MRESILHEKTLQFAANIVKFYEDFLLLKKDNTIAKQLIRAATSIGANIKKGNLWQFKSRLYFKTSYCLKRVF